MELEQRRYDLGTLKNSLLERPQGQAAKSLIDNALRLADRFLPYGESNDNMWYWIRVYTDPATNRLASSMLPKRFEPDLMLETYLQSLALFAAAVEHGGYTGALRPRIERHGEGVVYAVAPTGELLWYRHDGSMTGAPTWPGPSPVGTGWGHFRSLFATGSGRIYAVQPNGELYYYEHTGWADGKPTWLPHQVLGPGFDRFAWLFPAMWGTPKEDVVR
jgi:hypothetical protein